MATTDTIARSSILLHSTTAKKHEAKTNVKPMDQAPADSLAQIRLKKKKPFNLSALRFEHEGYFKGSKYFKLEKGNVWYGAELGDPVPYTLNTDNTLAGVLLVCFIWAMFTFSVSRSFIVSQLQTFFGASRSMRAMADSIPEGKVMPFLVMQTSLLLSVISFMGLNHFFGTAYDAEKQLVKIGIFFAVFIGYFIIKRLLYTIVNWTFFEYDQNRCWSKARLFLNTIEGVLLFPLVLLMIYFKLSFHIALIYSVIVVFTIKILHLYKSYTIFFSRTTISMQIFLYFCSLEIIPLMLLLGALVLTGNYLN